MNLEQNWQHCVIITTINHETFPLQGHMEQIFSSEWSPSGQYLATVCKDGKIRIFNPRTGSTPIVEGGEIVAKKGARVAWVLDEQYLIVTGFSK